MKILQKGGNGIAQEHLRALIVHFMAGFGYKSRVETIAVQHTVPSLSHCGNICLRGHIFADR